MPRRSWRRLAADGYAPMRLEAVAAISRERVKRSGRRLRRHVGKLELLDDGVALVHGEEIVTGLDHFVAALIEEGAQSSRPTSRFEEEDRVRARDRLLRALECLQFHALEVELDEIDARQGQGIDRDFLDRDGLAGGIVDGLADEFGVGARAQFEIAEVRGEEVVGGRDLHDAGLGGDRGMHGDGVEAVVDAMLPASA